MEKTPLLSVVIIGRNEGQRLAACIHSAWGARDTAQPLEVIYVDSASSDGSAELAAQLGARVIELRGGKLSAARARNAGWRCAAAPMILFLDGDTTLHPDFVKRALAEFEDPRIAVVWGHRRESRADSSVYNRVLDLDWIYRPGLAEFCGGDAVMRRSALELSGGFNPDLIAGEEPDLCRRLRSAGLLILHIDAPMTLHDLAIYRFSQYWRRAVRAGYAYAEIAARYRDTPDPCWSAESQSNLLRGFLYIFSLLGLGAASLLLWSWVPMLCGTIGAAAVVLRTAFIARWKQVPKSTLLLFGIHSHLQHIPILQGQLVYLWGRKRRKTHGLIEYKREP